MIALGQPRHHGNRICIDGFEKRSVDISLLSSGVCHLGPCTQGGGAKRAA